MHEIRERLSHNQRGASVVEFALLAPVFVTLLFGMLGYGQYFYISHSVQQIANNAARASIAGLTTAERTNLAIDAVAHEGTAHPSLLPERITASVADTGGYTRVTVRYDASNIAILRTGVFPAPAAVLVREGLIRNGGVS